MTQGGILSLCCLSMRVSYLESKRSWRKGHLHGSARSWSVLDLTKGREGLALSYIRRLMAATDIYKEHSNGR